MAKFDDCFSCAFYEVEQSICDLCFSAEQWEPCTDVEFSCSSNRHFIKLKKGDKRYEEAEAA